MRVQEFDKGRGPVGLPSIGQACDLPTWPDQGPREGSLVKFRSGASAQMPILTANVVTPLNEPGGGNNPPENSSGEAATFPEALDTTNKEESIWHS